MDLFISRMATMTKATSPNRLGRGDTSGFRFDNCRVRHEVFYDSFTGRGAGRVSQRRILCKEFHRTHDSITSTEQVHCHHYPPLTTITFNFTQNDYITDPQGFRPAASDSAVSCGVLTSPATSEHLAGKEYEPYDPGADPKGFWQIVPFKWMVIFFWSTVHRSCCYHLSYYFGLDFAFSTGCSHKMWPPRIEVVATRVYSTKMLHRLRNPHASWDQQCFNEKGNFSTRQS